MSDCCQLMKRCVIDWHSRSAGLARVAMANIKTGDVTHRMAYKEKASLKTQILYINFCPWCGTKYNEDLQSK